MRTKHRPVRIAITTGEPAGIGPDLAVLLAQAKPANDNTQLIVCACPEVLKTRANQLGLPLDIRLYSEDDHRHAEQYELIVKPFTTAAAVVSGQLDVNNAAYVLAMLDFTATGCMQGDLDAMVTGPLHKGIINEAGLAFTGHTEYLADLSEAWPVMMLATNKLRVALATTHLPLRDVADAINADLLEKVLGILHRDLQEKFTIANPRILVSGLNPHAGEDGHLGREELDIIEPSLKKLRAQGMQLIGPLPADTLFTPKYLDHADAVLAMYHDQGLPVLKYSGFGKAVNITLGLPFIRTSVDHGTALDLAGTGNIDTGSLIEALTLAQDLATQPAASS